MQTKILLFGLLVLAAGCDSGSDDKTPVAGDASGTTVKVAGAVEERDNGSAAFAAAIADLPVPPEATLVSDTPTARTFNLPAALSVDDAHTWFSGRLPEGRSFDDWSWCGKSQDSLGVSWQWQRTVNSVRDTLSVDLGRDDRTGEGYVLVIVRPNLESASCDAG